MNLEMTEGGFVNATKDGFELCVLCWEPTDVKQDVDIRKRENYVEGSGQYCDNCYNLNELNGALN